MEKVFIYGETEYTIEKMRALTARIFADTAAQEFLKPGTRVLVKPNLVAKNGIESGATTHPLMLRAVCERLLSLGCSVSVAESHGGTYTDGSLFSQFKACGVTDAVAGLDVRLCTKAERVDVPCPDGVAVKSFELIKPMTEADVIVDLCKIKTHALTGFSGAAKNMFGAVPGLSKFELHARFTEAKDFTRMLNDLCLLLKPRLCIADGIRGMEGNGPTAGKTRDFGFVVASRCAFSCDRGCVALLGIDAMSIPQLADAIERGLCTAEFSHRNTNLTKEEFEKLRIKDILPPDTHSTGAVSMIARLQKMGGGRVIKLFQPKPKVRKRDCVGCGKCAEYCPVHTIEMKKGRPKIHRDKCIRCFCCQELCPKKAIYIKTSKILNL